MSTHPQPKIPSEEYLRRERLAESKSEYLNGEVFAMAGASRNHRRISTNILTFLAGALEEGTCEVDNSDTRLFIPGNGLYTYPDVVVVCGEPMYQDDQSDTLLNPSMIFEVTRAQQTRPPRPSPPSLAFVGRRGRRLVRFKVLSPSTAAYDRGDKFRSYRLIPAFREYVLVSQSEMLVERYFLQERREWLYSAYEGADAVVPLMTAAVELPLRAVYRNVDKLG